MCRARGAYCVLQAVIQLSVILLARLLQPGPRELCQAGLCPRAARGPVWGAASRSGAQGAAASPVLPACAPGRPRPRSPADVEARARTRSGRRARSAGDDTGHVDGWLSGRSAPWAAERGRKLRGAAGDAVRLPESGREEGQRGESLPRISR